MFCVNCGRKRNTQDMGQGSGTVRKLLYLKENHYFSGVHLNPAFGDELQENVNFIMRMHFDGIFYKMHVYCYSYG